MYDKSIKQGIILHVVRRDKVTMIPEILKHVNRGSEVWSDMWKAYHGLSNHGYSHKTGNSNHSKEFKSADGVGTGAP
ncbi:hypothetical protein FOCC_FOCC014178 [Frankliniella occidentalis]|nr:hypothetical protein FOCC_FOCC014178 [Frankliniella occidentalis]